MVINSVLYRREHNVLAQWKLPRIRLRPQTRVTAARAVTKKPAHVSLVAGSGSIRRAYRARPPRTRPDGTPVNAVFGFTKMLMKLIGATDAE